MYPGIVPSFDSGKTPNLKRLADGVRSLVMAYSSDGSISKQSAIGLEVTASAPFTAYQRNNSLRLHPGDKVVVVSREPMDTDYHLSVRPIRYRHNPPEPIEHQKNVEHVEAAVRVGSPYEYAGYAFDAYPDFGRQAADYREFFWDLESQGSPGFEAQYLRAFRYEGSWIVQYPAASSSLSFVVIRGIPSMHGEFLEVQHAMPTPTDPWDGLFEARGELTTILTMPHFEGRHYVPYVSNESVLTKSTAIVVSMKIGRLMYAFPVPRLGTITLASNVQWTDCIGPMVGAP